MLSRYTIVKHQCGNWQFMINMSFSQATFPSSHKHAIITPLLKKPNLDPFDLKSYRPISNLPFISKFTERLAVKQFNDHITANHLLPSHQSAYRLHHSTETAVTAVYNDIARAVDRGEVCALVLLDLSAAFDTVDHNILFDVLTKRFGVQATAHGWFQTYLSDRSQCVRVDLSSSNPVILTCGVPQGSVLGPVNFIDYTEDIDSIIDVDYHLYADDSQLIVHTNLSDIDSHRSQLEQCIMRIHDWCNHRRLQLNPDKTELIWFGSKKNMNNLRNLDTTIQLGQCNIKPSSCVRDLGVLFDSELSLKQHVSRTVATCFLHLRRLRKLQRVLDIDTRKRLACAFVLSRIDYCNSVLASQPDCVIAPLQRVLNATARFVANLQPRDHVSPTLRSLHWLYVRQRVVFKLCTIMHAVHYNNAPQYISDIVTPVSSLPGRSHLRSASKDMYVVERNRTSIGARAFSIAGPTAWNSLPTSIKQTANSASFKRLLKTYLFDIP